MTNRTELFGESFNLWKKLEEKEVQGGVELIQHKHITGLE